MSSTAIDTKGHGHHDAHDAHHDHHGPTGIMRWITTTNHKDIGTMYLVFALGMLFIGGAMEIGRAHV